jgi:hypothetical protein
LLADLVAVRHGFNRCNTVKPLARHVHQTRVSSDLVDVSFISRFSRFFGDGEDHARNGRW